MSRLNNIYTLIKYTLLPLLLAFSMAMPLQGQTVDDFIVKHTETNGQCQNDASIFVSVTPNSDVYEISKVQYKFYNEETDAEIAIQSDEKGLAASLYPGSYRVEIKVLFKNGNEVKTSLEHLTVTTSYKKPTIAIVKNRPTLKGYPSSTGIIGVKVSNGSSSTYTAKLIKVPSTYGRDLPSITIPRWSTRYFYDLPAGEYQVQVNDQCITYPAQKVTIETTDYENPPGIVDNDVIYIRSECGHCKIWNISNSNSAYYTYPTDTLAKYYDIAIASKEEFDAKTVSGITWYNIKEVPGKLGNGHKVAYDKSEDRVLFALEDSWYNTSRLSSEKQPALYMKQRHKASTPQRYDLDYKNDQHWIDITTPPADDKSPCFLPTGKTTISLNSNQYRVDYCPPLKVELKKGNEILATETLTLQESSKKIEFEYERGTTYNLIATDNNGDKRTHKIFISDLYTGNTYSTSNLNYCDGVYDMKSRRIVLYDYSNVILPYKEEWNNFTVTLKKAPSNYVPIDGSMKKGEVRKIENNSTHSFYPFAEGQTYPGNNDSEEKFVFGITTPCGEELSDEIIHLSALSAYSQGQDSFAPKVDVEKCGYTRVYPFPNGIGSILLKDGSSILNDDTLSLHMTNFSRDLIPESSIVTFDGRSSTMRNKTYVSFRAEDASKVYFEFPSVETTVTYKLYNSTYANTQYYLTTTECYPATTVNLVNTNIGFSRDSFVGYSCPNGLSAFIAFQPNNYVGTLHVELRSISDDGKVFYKNENLTVKKGDFVSINLESTDGVTPLPTEYLLYLKDNECLNDNKNGVPIALNDLSSVSIVTTTQKQTKYCEGDPILLECVSLGGKVTYEWTLPNGEKLTGRKAPIDKAKAAKHSGKYLLRARNVICKGSPTTVEIPFVLSVAPSEMWWASDATDANWNNLNNWCNAEGVHIHALPAHCTAVHLPATVAKHFPDLDPEITEIGYWGRAECDDIYFHYGSQLGLPQRLTYDRAYINYNFGKENGGTITAHEDAKHPGSDAVLMNRDQWYMLSTPIKNVLSGDFSLGGYPKTYQRYLKLDIADTNLTDASFDAPIASMIKNLGQYDNAIAYKVVGYDANTIGKKDHKTLNALNGIVQIPFYMMNRRKQAEIYGHFHFTRSTTSYFRYYNEETLEPLNYVEKVARNKDEDFRFIFEKGDRKTIGAITVDGKKVEGYSMPFSNKLTSNIRMVGNPFMTAIDFDKLYEVNKNLIEPYYYLNTNNTWKVYHKDVTTNQIPKEIPALQAFVLKKKSDGELLFPTIGDSNVLLPPNKQTILQSDNPSDEKTFDNDMLISVEADNAKGKGTEAILLPVASIVSAPALIYSGSVERPIIYFVDSVGATPNAIHAGKNRAVIPMGVYCENAGNVRLHFHIGQQNAFNKLTLYDRLTKEEQDLLSMPYYDFNHGFKDGYRFELRMDYPGVSADLATESIDTSFSVERMARGYKVLAGKGIVGYALYSMEGKVLSDKSYSSSLHELALEDEDFSAPRILVIRLMDGSSETIKLLAI